MNSKLILWPVLAQIFLILIIYAVLGARKAKAVKSGSVNLKATALDNKAWPDDVLKVSNNIDNQFEVPIVFFVLCLLFYGIGQVDILLVSLAWAYVISRYAHAYVHVRSNYVPLRMRIFTVGCLILLIMTLIAVWKLLQR
jgi:hypothetical protein